MYCQGSADNKSTFLPCSAGLASSTIFFFSFSLYGTGKENNLVQRELRVDLFSVVQCLWLFEHHLHLFPTDMLLVDTTVPCG